MHIQSKSNAAKSPANLADFLDVLAADIPPHGPINIEGVTGCGIETGSGIVFSLSHDQHDAGVARLRDAGYTVDENTDLFTEAVDGDPNQPGVLADIVRRAKDSPEANGRPIDTVLVGFFTGQPDMFYVQVSFIDAPFFEI
jgi:hypothetical protein